MHQQKIVTLVAIDIGSNTIEVLIARCVPDNLEIIEHQSTLARLGESVDDKAEISREKSRPLSMQRARIRKLQKSREPKRFSLFHPALVAPCLIWILFPLLSNVMDLKNC